MECTYVRLEEVQNGLDNRMETTVSELRSLNRKGPGQGGGGGKGAKRPQKQKYKSAKVSPQVKQAARFELER